MIVIHFGLRKAGSSTLQQFLRANQSFLREIGYDYAPIGHLEGRSHLNLAYDVRRFENYNPLDGGIKDLKKYWLQHKSKALIVSSEILEEADRVQVKRLHGTLSEADDEFILYMVIRDLTGLVTSSYSQNAKTTGVTNFDEFFTGWIPQRRTNFFQTAGRWAKFFGWEAMQVRVLDKGSLYEGDLVADFSKAIGLKIREEDRKYLKISQNANVSPGWRVVEALRALYDGRHGLPENHSLIKIVNGEAGNRALIRPIAETLGDRLGWNQDKGAYLTREQAEACLSVYTRSINAFNAVLPSPLPQPKSLEERGFVAREFLPDSTKIAAVDLRQFYDELADTILNGKRRAR